MNIETCCSICGDDINNGYQLTLKCNHTFHYECVFLTFKNTKSLECPYCRSQSDFLPIVNGLKKLICNIHYSGGTPPNYENKKCNVILKRGKNKGNECGKNCKIGFNQCSSHYK
tara:strand:- start:260 stop:601 length:342 start_codon:yes stop_codon:yes gene_type:complete